MHVRGWLLNHCHDYYGYCHLSRDLFIASSHRRYVGVSFYFHDLAAPHRRRCGSLLSSPQFNFPPLPHSRPPSRHLLPHLSVSLGLKCSQAYLLSQFPHSGHNIVCLAILKLPRPATTHPFLFAIPAIGYFDGYWLPSSLPLSHDSGLPPLPPSM